MILACAALTLLAFVVSLPGVALARGLGRRMGRMDGAGVAGQVKAPARSVPNTGGVGIFLGVTLPVLGGLLCAREPFSDWAIAWFPALKAHLPGIRAETTTALVFLTALALVHVLGVIDDRRPLGPWLKLVLMLGTAAGLVLATDSRLMTMLDGPAGGAWLSVIVTVLWLVVVMNALNFMDNMDGLSAGVAAIAAGCFLAATLQQGQWFVSAALAVVLGSALGFLVFNFPRHAQGGATVFMGDGGSLVLGLALGFLTVRTTYVGSGPGFEPGAWYGVLMPLVVLAVPLYDLCSVVVIRVSQGRSPLVGDLQHLSHRLVARGLSRRDAVILIYVLTGLTAIGSITLPSMRPWQAILLGVQTALVLLALALFEGRAQRHARTATADRPDAGDGA
ncbi:MAG: MraY family glycosyltransferase [Phycisphaerales bacterium]